jgi:hypothetical protein
MSVIETLLMLIPEITPHMITAKEGKGLGFKS